MTEDMSHTMGSRDVNIPSMMDEAWLNSLDEICNVILCEISLDGAGRGVVRTSRVDGVGLMALNSDITRAKDDDRQRSVRLLLVEGLSKTIVQSLRSQSFDLTSSFYKRHLEGVASTTQSYPIGQTLHLKWVRVALQSRRQWDLGQVTPSKGQSKWQRAPVGHGIVFEQCRRLPTVHRAYETIDNCVNASADLGSNNQSRNNDTIVAAEQMCSVLSLDNASNALALDNIIIFDAPRRYTVARKMGKIDGLIRMPAETIDSFLDFESDQQRFVCRLQDYFRNNSYEAIQAGTVENILMTMACEDQLDVLYKLIDTLDKIDLKMAEDKVVQEFIRDWRKLFGTWRVHLNHVDRFVSPIQAFKDLIQHRKGCRQIPQSSLTTHSEIKDSPPENPSDLLTERLAKVNSKSSYALRRCEATFAALMSTMTIIESQLAIQEASQVSKVTKLAFFFIPLSFVSSVFGMNIAEFKSDSLHAWIWMSASISVLLVTYTVLFSHDAKSNLEILIRTPRDKVASHLWFFRIVLGSLGWRRGISVAASYLFHRSIAWNGANSELVNVTVRLRRSDEGETTEFDIDKL